MRKLHRNRHISPIVQGLLVATMLAGVSPAAAETLDLAVLESAQKPEQAIRRLAATTDQLRLAGETAERIVTFYAPRDEVLKYRKLQIDTLTAVSAAPEYSNMRVEVNGQPIGQFELKATEANQLRTFDVPSGLISEGFNEVRFVANHLHRVDCSIPATYELWTALDPANTGFVFDSRSNRQPQAMTDLGILRAVPTNENGATEINLVLAGNAGISNIDRALSVAQHVAILGKYQTPEVKIQSQPGVGAGLDIILGTTSELTSAGYKLDQASTEVPGLSLLRMPDTGRIAMILSAPSRPALDLTIETFRARISELPLTGSPKGIAAFENKYGRQVETGQDISLVDLGVESKQFAGRLLKQDFNLQLPADFFVGDYGKATISLNIDALTELNGDNRLQIFANGKALASTMLTKDGVSPRTPLSIPLGGFTPGYNTLRMEVSAVTKGDSECNVITRTNQNRLFLDASASSIRFDTVARMRVSPSISVNNLMPKSPMETRPTLVQVPADDIQSFEAAAQLIVAMAAINQEARPVSLLASTSLIGNQPGLIVGPADRLSGVAKDIYFGVANQDRNTNGGGLADLLRLDQLTDRQKDLWSDARRFAATVWRGMGFRLSSMGEVDHTATLGGQDILFAQRTSDIEPEDRWNALLGKGVSQDSWTVVTGTTSQDIKQGMTSLLGHQRLSWLNGDTAIYKSSSQLVFNDQYSKPTYFSSIADPANLSNSRLVIAGVISHNMLPFVMFMGVLCLVLGFFYYVVLRKSGR